MVMFLCRSRRLTCNRSTPSCRPSNSDSQVSDQTHRVLEYRAAIELNRQIFLLQRAHIVHAFLGLYDYCDQVTRRLQTGRTREDKTYVSFIPFMLLMQRQAMNAFESLSSARSYDAWLVFRPGLESPLIIGKWIDDPALAELWSHKDVRFREYTKAYSGKALISKALPRATDIQKTLSRLNDDFVHANDRYYARHTRMEDAPHDSVFLKVVFTDDDDDAEAHSLAFLHLFSVVLDSVDSMFATHLPNTRSHSPQTAKLEAALATRARDLIARVPAHAITLRELGLWSGLEEPKETA